MCMVVTFSLTSCARDCCISTAKCQVGKMLALTYPVWPAQLRACQPTLSRDVCASSEAAAGGSIADYQLSGTLTSARAGQIASALK